MNPHTSFNLKATPFVKVKEQETGIKRPSTTLIEDKVPTDGKLETIDENGAEGSEPDYVKTVPYFDTRLPQEGGLSNVNAEAEDTGSRTPPLSQLLVVCAGRLPKSPRLGQTDGGWGRRICSSEGGVVGRRPGR